MAEIHLMKHFGMLAPANEEAEEIIAKMRHGKSIVVKYSFPRNLGNHNRFFAFLKVIFEMQDFFDNPHHFRKWLILKSGYYQTVQTPNGGVFFDPDSIAFQNMDEVKFRDLFSRCIDAFLSVWGDRVSREELERIIDFS